MYIVSLAIMGYVTHSINLQFVPYVVTSPFLLREIPIDKIFISHIHCFLRENFTKFRKKKNSSHFTSDSSLVAYFVEFFFSA
jgi:hypothetical protein